MVIFGTSKWRVDRHENFVKDAQESFLSAFKRNTNIIAFNCEKVLKLYNGVSGKNVQA